MQLGYYGLGKMGANMVQLLVEKGHDVIASNRSKEPIDAIAQHGATPAYSIAEMVEKVAAPRTIWLMVPPVAVDSVLEELLPLLAEGDTVVDGGNTPFKETMRRAQEITQKGIRFVDAGVSGGPGGARNGACVMVGGQKEDFEKLEPLFTDMSAPEGYGYMGTHGAGHFVKMVHNGIEYGMMQALAEGFHIMKESDFGLDLEEVARVYNHQSVITSRLVGWLQDGFKEYGTDLEKVSGSIDQLGEGKWTAETAKEMGIPAPIIQGSVDFRTQSKDNPSYTGKIVSVLRGMFGGHPIDGSQEWKN